VNSRNKIDSATLLAAADEITQRQHRHVGKLDLTSNFIYEHVQQEIQRRYSRIAKSVVAPSLFPGVQWRLVHVMTQEFSGAVMSYNREAIRLVDNYNNHSMMPVQY